MRKSVIILICFFSFLLRSNKMPAAGHILKKDTIPVFVRISFHGERIPEDAAYSMFRRIEKKYVTVKNSICQFMLINDSAVFTKGFFIDVDIMQFDPGRELTEYNSYHLSRNLTNDYLSEEERHFFKQVAAEVQVTRKYISAKMNVMYSVYKDGMGNLVATDHSELNYFWENKTLIYDGDAAALGPPEKDILKNKPKQPPSPKEVYSELCRQFLSFFEKKADTIFK